MVQVGYLGVGKVEITINHLKRAMPQDLFKAIDVTPIDQVIRSKRVSPQSFFTGMVSNAMDKAANCTECSDCEERCPYHLPIREMIVEQREWFQVEKKKYLEQVA